MQQKELRIALVCYGGVSLAVYMHGVTKEVWKLARASQAAFAPAPPRTADAGSETVYRRLLAYLEARHGLRLRVLPDIIAGASAGGINGVFLAQAIHSGQSLEPLTRLWLDRADVDVLLDPDARVWSRLLKFWAVPLVNLLLSRPGNGVSASVAPETRAEVRGKLSRLIRSRWFEPPFGGIGFSRLLAEALDAMAATPAGPPLLPPGHPLDLFVTATDFRGSPAPLRLHSPALVEESEHRLSIGFRGAVPARGGTALAPLLDLVFAARATASFPGAFPPLRPAEIDALAAERGRDWPSRAKFLARAVPHHVGDIDSVALVDGSVLVNAPFADAIAVLADRPAQREVDRRFVYIDPRPKPPTTARDAAASPGFFAVIFGALSTIPREQPIRDNLDELARQSREKARLRDMVEALRPEVETAVEHLFGFTLFLNRPTARRLANWRSKAQKAASERASYAYQAYARLKSAGLVDALARVVAEAAPNLGAEIAYGHIAAYLTNSGVDLAATAKGALVPAAIAFLRDHDLPYRIRRLRLLARRLSAEWDNRPEIATAAREAARDAVYRALALYFARDGVVALGSDFPQVAANLADDPGAVLRFIADRRQLSAVDGQADTLLAKAMAAMPPPLRRLVLLTYLGFPFYDTVTLPLLRELRGSEFDPVKVDRISPEDAGSIRSGGAAATLRGTEFFNFGAFFSRAYRENDYLWGRLQGAERMVDLIASTLPPGENFDPAALAQFKRDGFLAILDEEQDRLTADPTLIAAIRAEIFAK